MADLGTPVVVAVAPGQDFGLLCQLCQLGQLVAALVHVAETEAATTAVGTAQAAVLEAAVAEHQAAASETSNK